ncbi:MAG: hypothetical protein ACOC2G_00145 [Bacillota bacterium]
MTKNKRKLLFLIFSLVLILLAVYFIFSGGNSVSVKDYFPGKPGVYLYQGEGMEFASFRREIKYVDGPYIQFHDLSGTEMAHILEVSEEKLTRIYQEPEFYDKENLLNQVDELKLENEVILKKPLKEGHRWETENYIREIKATGLEVEVPAGTFEQVLKIKISPREEDENQFIRYEYYAPRVGLVKSESISDDYRVISRLKEIKNIAEK